MNRYRPSWIPSRASFFATTVFSIELLAATVFITGPKAYSESFEIKPAPCQETYRIQLGDTLSGIASELISRSHSQRKVYFNGGVVDELIKINKKYINNPNLIYPGRTILLPFGLSWTGVDAVIACIRGRLSAKLSKTVRTTALSSGATLSQNDAARMPSSQVGGSPQPSEQKELKNEQPSVKSESRPVIKSEPKVEPKPQEDVGVDLF